MSQISRLLSRIEPVANASGLVAYIGPDYIPEDSDDASLFVGTGPGTGEVLLEIRFESGYFILERHRTADLTASYKGKPITESWINRFILRHTKTTLG